MTSKLGIERFTILAHSAGANYALGSIPRLTSKLVGPLRFLSPFPPTHLPCMPTSYAITRSLPTGLVSVAHSISASLSSPVSFGHLSPREALTVQDPFSRAILRHVGKDNRGPLGYDACELDRMLTMEIARPMGFQYWEVDYPVRCWHGVEDEIVPVGTALWLQTRCRDFRVAVVPEGSHNLTLDLDVIRAVFEDCAKGFAIEVAERAAAVADHAVRVSLEKDAAAAAAVLDPAGGVSGEKDAVVATVITDAAVGSSGEEGAVAAAAPAAEP
ncbi:hypothetical protein BDK51DRAFT_32534 [Blyttiomyces helicus]|uniref:Alpha/Beta hydrolase protein n=1 Tax=Blyttiomyces helicus TaxID=388810 RepID=A0A4P9W3M6_9FUNG|nr:hypothetical protein BDK51DRAFT_32534 [Blyttiomyces helicus]|eukprot:RKO86744.1 hypothetical protein BDK51DRAFT_32534 [Blyttiomyces helicus]